MEIARLLLRRCLQSLPTRYSGEEDLTDERKKKEQKTERASTASERPSKELRDAETKGRTRMVARRNPINRARSKKSCTLDPKEIRKTDKKATEVLQTMTTTSQ